MPSIAVSVAVAVLEAARFCAVRHARRRLLVRSHGATRSKVARGGPRESRCWRRGRPTANLDAAGPGRWVRFAGAPDDCESLQRECIHHVEAGSMLHRRRRKLQLGEPRCGLGVEPRFRRSTARIAEDVRPCSRGPARGLRGRFPAMRRHRHLALRALPTSAAASARPWATLATGPLSDASHCGASPCCLPAVDTGASQWQRRRRGFRPRRRRWR